MVYSAFILLEHTSCIFLTMMDQNNKTASIESLPSELLRCLIFPQVLPSSLLACLFVSRHFLKNILACSSFKPATNRHQQRLLEELYETGSVILLEWFNEYLKYPPIFSRNKEMCLDRAAAGSFLIASFFTLHEIHIYAYNNYRYVCI